MSTDDIVTCCELAIRLRQHEPAHDLDSALDKWLDRARGELSSRGELERIAGLLPVYYDPARREPVYGPGAQFVSPPAGPAAVVSLCQIAAG
jgi:hypothetical protein